MTERKKYPCLSCWTEVGFRQLRCTHCDRSLLYGLIAEAVDDGRVLDRGAAVLLAVPGALTKAEARRRLSEGLPLVVGLTRETIEQLQDDLIGAGVVGRIGPAPPGTVPLEPGSDAAGVKIRVVLAVLVPLLAASWLLLRPSTATKLAVNTGATVPRPATPVPADLAVAATIEPYGLSSYNLVGIARAIAPLESTADLELQLRDGPQGGLLHARRVAPSSHALEMGSVTFRESLHEVGFGGGEEVWLIGIWGELRSAPQLLRVPSRSRR